MPASREHLFVDNGTGYLRISIEDDIGRQSVYFTDQEPTFSVVLDNLVDKPVRVEPQVYIEFEEQDSDIFRSEKYPTTVPAEESVVHSFPVDLLPYQGTAIVGLRGAFRSNIQDEGERYRIERLSETRTKNPLYTCMVFDRDFYRANYFRPKWAQYIAAFLAGLVVLIGIIQILIFLTT